MLTKTQLQSFDAGAYAGVIEKWGRAADAVSSASNTVSSTGSQMSAWTGRAADQALATMGDLVTVVAASPGLLSEAQDTVAAFVTSVSQQQAILKTALAKAQALQCTVGEDGTVTPPVQPPGEPPPVCSPDPGQEAALARAQMAYDNSPAVQTWRSATQEAPALQASIQEALRAATAADSRAAGDLDAGIRGGTDVKRIVAGDDPTGSYAANLFQDTQTLGDGKAWVAQYVDQTASLLSKAAGGNAGAVSELRLLTPLTYDQDFGAALMNRLGAAGLEKIPLMMGQGIDAAGYGDAGRFQAIRQNDQSVLRFLADSLASASDSPGLDPSFVQALTSNDRAKNPDGDGPGVGFWSLGQILGAASGAVPYDPRFLDTVGTAIIAYDKQQQANALIAGWEYDGPFQNPWANNLNLPASFNFLQANEPVFFGVTDSGGDPVYGLMHAATVSPQAALSLLSRDNYGDLTYLMGRTWTFDHGSAFGAAIASAGDQPGNAATALSAHALRDYLPHLGHMQNGQFVTASYDGGPLSGINAGLGQVVGYHMAQAYDAWAGIPDSGSRFLFPTVNQGLPSLLAAVSSDPSGYRALMAGAVANAKLNLQAVARADANLPMAERLADFDDVAKQQGQFVGYLMGSHNAALAAGGLHQDQIAAQSASQEATMGNFVSQGIGLIPLPGSSLVGSVFKTVLGDAVTSATSSSASNAYYNDALAAGGAGWSDAQKLVGQVVSSSMVSNGLWQPGTDPATWLSAHPGEPAFYTITTLANGQTQYDLIPPDQMTAQQYGAFAKWAQGGVGSYNDAAEGSVGNTITNAAGAVNDGTTQATQNLNTAQYPANP